MITQPCRRITNVGPPDLQTLSVVIAALGVTRAVIIEAQGSKPSGSQLICQTPQRAMGVDLFMPDWWANQHSVRGRCISGTVQPGKERLALALEVKRRSLHPMPQPVRGIRHAEGLGFHEGE